MSLLADFEAIVKYDEPMAKHTWFRLGGPVRYFIEPRNQDELAAVVKRCMENSVRIYALGRGSNLLVTDDFLDGAVIHFRRDYFGRTEASGEVIRVQAGVELGDLVQHCARDGMSGVECLVGIPGSVGGAIRMNAGGRFGDIGSVVEKVTAMDTTGEIVERKQEDLNFGYRSTNIMAKFILDVELKLMPGDPEEIGKTIKEVWMLKRNTQPTSSRNAGCVFKNPRAISAGAMIDKVGLKGTKVGGAVVSDRHANFILAEDGCTSSDVLKLIDLIREKVRERFDVELELELEIWR